MIDIYLEQFPTYYKNRLATLNICKELEDKALSHSRYDVIPEAFTKRRPNETEDAHKYAVENYRRITHELIESWLTKAGRIFDSSSFYISEASEDLKNRLATDKQLFMVNNQQFTWKEFVRNFIYPSSLINPNQIFHFFPFNQINPNESPYISLPENEDIGLKPTLIHYSKIRFANINLFVYEHETEYAVIKLKGNKDTAIPINYALDPEFWYRLVPIKDDEAPDGYRYVSEKWYTHNFGEVPYLWLSGKYQKSANGEVYLKSLLSSSFEHLDEFVGLFKDSQAVTTQHAYPHMYMADIDCPECDGVGTIASTGDTCMVCQGMGVMRKPDPTQVLRVPRTNKVVDGDMINPVMGWLSPNVEIMAHLNTQVKETFRNAFLSVGLRPFVDVSESGEAKKYRLEDMIDRLEDSSDMIQTFCEGMLTMLEKYIQFGKGEQKIIEVKVTKPKSFHALNKNELSLLMQESQGEVKKEIFKFAFLESNGNSEANHKISEVMFLYAPLLISDRQEQIDLVNLGVYDTLDIVRAEHAISVLKEIGKEKAFVTWDVSEIISKADIKLNEWGLLNVPLLKIDGGAIQ